MKFEKALVIINNLTNDFVKSIDPELSAELEEDFAYYWEDNKVGYALLTDVDVDNLWANQIKNWIDCSAIDGKFDFFMFSLMHEIGHHFTIDNWTDKQQEKIDKIKDFLDWASCLPTNFINDLRNVAYFNLPDEREATLWGIQYMLDHTQECERYWNRVKEIMHKISE